MGPPNYGAQCAPGPTMVTARQPELRSEELAR